MEFFIFALILIGGAEMTSKFNRLNSKIDKIKSVSKGEKDMSKICNELVGKKCNFLKFGEIVVGSMPVYTILDVDEQFIKVSTKDKKGKEKISIIRIDDISSIELVEG